MKKFLKIVLVILLVGFASAFVRGYKYQTLKAKQQSNKEEISEKIQNENSIIDDEIVVDLLNEETKENDPINTTDTNKKIDEKKDTKINNISEQKNTVNKNNSNVETKNNTTNSTTQNQNTIKEEVKPKEVKQENTITSNTTTSNNQKNSYIGVPNPNDFYYSFHHGKIDKQYSDLNSCYADSARVGFKDTVDILNITCFEVLDGQGTVLGIYMYVNCQSGNCERYK